VPHLNIPVSDELLWKVREKCVAEKMTQREFVIGILEAAVKSAALTGFNSQSRKRQFVAPTVESDGSSLAGNQSGQRSTPPRDEAETVPAPVTGPEVARNPTLPSDCHSPSLPKTKVKKLSAEEFMALSKSDRLKAQREGRF